MRKSATSRHWLPFASPRVYHRLAHPPHSAATRMALPRARRRGRTHEVRTDMSPVLEVSWWLEAIARISAAVNNVEPLSNVLNAIAATTCHLLGYRFGAVLLTDRTGAGDRLLIRGSYGLSRAYVESINTTKPIRIGGRGQYAEGPSSRAFRSHKPVVVRDFATDPSVGPWAGVAIEQGYRSMVVVPLVVSGKAIGTLNCYTTELHEFGHDEILLLVTIANQAAIAIEAARLRAQERATIASLEEARRSYQLQAEVLERSEEIHTHLTQTVLSDGGLTAIASALATILGGAVIIEDLAGVTLASAEGVTIPAVLPPEVHQDEAARQLVGEVDEGREPRELPQSGHPYFGQRTFLAPVVIGRDVVARLWVLGAAQPLQALERRALEHGTTVVALELLKQRIASEVEGRLRGELLDDLLTSRELDTRALSGRAALLGHDLRGPHVVLVAGIDPAPDAAQPAPETQASQLGKLHAVVNNTLRLRQAHALVAQRDGRVAVLLGQSARWTEDTVAELADLVRSAAQRYGGEVTASVAIGPWVNDIAAFQRCYRIARGALEVSQRASSRNRTIRVDDLGVYGLLLAVDRLEELVAFSIRTLGPLRRYDRRKGSELVETLRAYLAHGCRTADTSAALIVHPNTVAYRIRRIESLTGLDLSRRDAQLQVQLALIVEDIAAPATGEEASHAQPPDRKDSVFD